MNFVSFKSLSINNLFVCMSVELVNCIMANWKTAIGPLAESSRMARFHKIYNVVVSHKRKNIEVLLWSIGHDGVLNLYMCADYYFGKTISKLNHHWCHTVSDMMLGEATEGNQMLPFAVRPEKISRKATRSSEYTGGYL